MASPDLDLFELRAEPAPATAAQVAAGERMAAKAAAHGWTLAELDMDRRHQLAGEVLADMVPEEQRARWKTRRPTAEQELRFLVTASGGPAPHVVRACASCGEPFTTVLYVPGRRGRPAKYCSDACKQLAYRSRHPLPPPKPKAPPKPRECACCGRHFEPSRAGGRPGRFCSPGCKSAAYRRRQQGLPERMSRKGDARELGRWRR